MAPQAAKLERSGESAAGREPRLQTLIFTPPPSQPLSPATRKLLWADPAPGDTAGIQALRRHGFEVVHLTEAAALRDTLESGRFDLVLMEAVWPEEDGLSLCRELAAEGGAPVVLYSASTDSLDCVTGLEFGADDYVAKTAHPLELLARVRAVLRRMGTEAAARAAASGVRAWRYDEALRAVSGPGGTLVYLSVADNQLLAFLAARPREVVSRERLRRELYVDASRITPRAVDTRVTRLRRALQRCEGAGDMIATVRNGGYALNAAAEEGPDGGLILRASARRLSRRQAG
jgi:two-component system, OmpR family, response regulator